MSNFWLPFKLFSSEMPLDLFALFWCYYSFYCNNNTGLLLFAKHNTVVWHSLSPPLCHMSYTNQNHSLYWIFTQIMLYYRHKRNNRPQGVGLIAKIEIPPSNLPSLQGWFFYVRFRDFKEKRYLRLSKIKVSNAMSSIPKAIRSWKLKFIRTTSHLM